MIASKQNVYSIFPFDFNFKLFCLLYLTFILATIIGTLTHECGHYFAARLLGHEAKLHYAYTTWLTFKDNVALNTRNNFWILISGPLQTLLTGTFGLLLLYINRKSFHYAVKLTIYQWLLIFITLFWTRQIANFTFWIVNIVLSSKYRSHSDELYLARFLKIPEGTILTITALIGMVILLLIIFKFIPKQQRFTFIVAGFFGGISGYFLWIELFGKIVLP